ncbi:MAG: hypothetical protein HOC74_34870 [Gemmatimonadetes bacterium]|nr:hypothetical protein [Gemmatimonadota bacterium]
MLEEPYRWIEAIRNRREYLDDQLQGASPVVGMAYQGGLLLLTTTPGPRKLFEVYNEIAFAAIGHPADIEKLRKAVIDIAHVEGFNLSASDVSLQRLVSFGIGPLMKSAFDEIFRSPFIARVLLAELESEDGAFYAIDADGSFAPVGRCAAIAGTEASAEGAVARLNERDGRGLELEDALRVALEAWACGRLLAEGEEETPPDDVRIADFLGRTLAEVNVEAAVLDRALPTKSKFRLLQPADLKRLLAAYAN